MDWHWLVLLLLYVSGFELNGNSAVVAELRGKRLAFLLHSKCTYSYEVAVHAARGSQSTENDGYQLHVLVDVTQVSREDDDESSLHLCKLDVRQPRLRRVRSGRVTSYPVIAQFEDQLSKPFYFRQRDHGPVLDVLFPKSTESPQVAALKKGIAGAFQVNLLGADKSSIYEVQEQDDSGVFRAKYSVLSNNDTHTHLHRTWTNHDYQHFADGTPVKGTHKVQSYHSAHFLLKDGKVEQVHRSIQAFFKPASGHPRAQNHEDFEKQDIEIATTGYSKLKLKSCYNAHQRSKRSVVTDQEFLNTQKSVMRDSILFTDAEKINWTDVGGDNMKTRPLYELLRCFVDNTVQEREIAYCSTELHHLIQNDKSVFKAIKELVKNRNHQNLTSWSVFVSALAANGKYEAQNALADAVKTRNPRPLSDEEYESLLIAIHYLPTGPLHSNLFDALVTLSFDDTKKDRVTTTAMLVLAALTERAEKAGYNETLSESLAEMLCNRYKNKSSIYHPDSIDYEMQLRDHVWAFGNLGHHSVLPVILEHIGHDDSSIRSAVISAMRKMPKKYTDQHLMKALYRDEDSDVKAAVVSVFIDRHQNLSDLIAEGLEYAMWYADEGETLDSAIRVFLENHGNHSKAKYLRKRRSSIMHHLKALKTKLRPRAFKVGLSKHWRKVVGGEYMGAEAAVGFTNELSLRVGIFGAKIDLTLDNSALLQAHFRKYNFEIAKGKAAFRAGASFKNDFPKDLLHTVADVGDELLRHFESITSVIPKQIEKFRKKIGEFTPIRLDELTQFVNSTDQFLDNLKIPLQALRGFKKVASYSKEVGMRVNRWKVLFERATEMHRNLKKTTSFDVLLKKTFETVDKILGVVFKIRKNMPNNLPKGFSIKNLLEILWKTSAKQQKVKIEKYFRTLGSSVPEGFTSQLPFKISIHFSFSLDKFQDVLSKSKSLSNNVLHISSLLNSFKDTKLPAIKLNSFESNLKLESPGFQRFSAIIWNVGNFFNQFTDSNFELEKFFEDILPSGKADLKKRFPDLIQTDYRPNTSSIDSANFLKTFLSEITTQFDSYSSDMCNISEIICLFQELGPPVTQFFEVNGEEICKLREAALDFSREYQRSGKNFEREGISALKEVDEAARTVLSELQNFTVLVENLEDEVEYNFKGIANGFVSKSLQEFNAKMRGMKNLANNILDFTTSTSSQVSGACTEASVLTEDLIDEIQSSVRQTLHDFNSFNKPVAAKITKAGENMRHAVKNMETWYQKNMADRTGKISRLHQIISDFLPILGTKKGFFTTVKEIASAINEVLNNLRKVPKYASKVGRTVDEVITFANRAPDYTDEIKKLDLRKMFGCNFELRVKRVCNEFQNISFKTLKKLRNYDVEREVISFFNKETKTFINKASSNFREVKMSVAAIQSEVKEISSMVAKMDAVLGSFKPFTKILLPVLAKLEKLPDCQRMKEIMLDNTRPCINKAQVVGRSFIEKYKDLKSEIKVFNSLIPEMWTNFRIQRCGKGGSCISKAFIKQGKVVAKKANSFKINLGEVSLYNNLLERCQDSVNNITAVFSLTKVLVQQVQHVSVRDDFQTVMTMLQTITGQKPKKSKRERRKRTLKNSITVNPLISDYIQKAKRINTKLQAFQESTLHALHSVHDKATTGQVQKLLTIRSRLQLSYQLWKKTQKVDKDLKALDTGCRKRLRSADNFDEVVAMFSNSTISLLTNAGEISDVVRPHLYQYTLDASEAVAKVNGLVNKVSDFLNKIQTRQRGLDPKAYKPWQNIPYCSKEICLRSIRRSSTLYLETIFPWKFPHLDDLSSMQKTGHWLTPGLFDDYKVQGISQLSDSDMILGMHGVASNKEKASLLVVTNFDGGVRKIVQLSRQGNPLNVEIGGVALARDYIWISNCKSNEIMSIKTSTFKSVLTSAKPALVEISKTVSVKARATSVSYDEISNILWLTSGNVEKAYGYKLSANGEFFTGLAPDRVIHIGKNAQGMTIVRQFGGEYACISKCALIAGFQCKLEFHDLSKGHETGEKTLARVVRTPSGLESVTRVDKEVIAVAFSSGTFAEKENVELSGGEYEDRYFKLRLPILKTTFEIMENCFYFRLLGNYVIQPRPIFPLGDVKCGSKRKRSIFQQLLETDVYHERLEKVHQNAKRIKRNLVDPSTCLSRTETLLSKCVTFFKVETTIMVVGIPIKFFAGASGHYNLGYQVEICLKSKVFELGLVPGAWVTVYAGASLSFQVIEAGVTVEARLLETNLVPAIRSTIFHWPIKACIELRLLMTPLSIRVYLWYRFIKITAKVWPIGIKVGISWGAKKKFKEWFWATKKIDRVIFTKCSRNEDKTRPKVGYCTARQVADKKFLIQWHGFQEDTRIKLYNIRVGSIKGSGDDFSAWVGTSLSLMVNDLPIMHGRNVFVSVLAANEEGLESSFAHCPEFQARRKGPQLRFVYDGALEGKDVDYQSDNFSLGMNFFSDSNFSEVVNLKWGVSSQSLCTFDESEADIVPLSPLGDSSAIQVSGLSLLHGKKYFTRLYAMNRYGLKAITCSNGVLIDRTPPVPGSFQDGTGNIDASFIPSLVSVRGKFQQFTDPESPIIKYEWKIEGNMSENFKDVTPFVRIPLTQEEPLMESLSLTPGAFYRLVLRGTNEAGLQSIIKTNGFRPDETPPYCRGSVIDVIDETDTHDVDFVGNLKNIQAKWKCFDLESGISSQFLAIGTYPTGKDVRLFEDIKVLSQPMMESEMSYVKFYNVTILPNKRYHVTVKIINGAGLKETITSDGILLDTTPPRVASQYIKDGKNGKDKNFTKERFAYSAHWEQAFSDVESGVVEYRAGLGTKPGLADVEAFYTVGLQTNLTITGLILESGRVYYVTVVCCNGVGLCANASSNGLTVDFIPPHSGKVVTGLNGPPVLYQRITTSVWARWKWCLADEKRGHVILNSSQCSNDSFYDVHSGISMFGISVFSQENHKLLKPFKSVGTKSYSGRTIDMEDGIYSVAIEVTDKAGVTSQGFSNSFIVDSSPPLIRLLQHGHFGETMTFVNTTVITFRSYFIVEDDLSVITAYKIGVGTSSRADDVVKFETFTLSEFRPTLRANWTSHVSTTLENSRRYFITILARNSAGLFSIKSSKPLLSDFVAPKNGFVMDGWDSNDAEFQSVLSVFRAHWYGFTDFSGIEAAYLGLSSKVDTVSCDVKKEELVPKTSVAYVLSGLSLNSGKKYYACLKLVDRAGNAAFFHSNGILVDSTPPRTGFVNDGGLDQEVEMQTDSSVLVASWANFRENETRIVSYLLAFGSAPGAQDIQDFTNVGLVNTSASSRLKVHDLTNGQHYYATVIAINVLGIPSSMVSSNGVLVDFTPPIFSQPIRDGEDPTTDRGYTSKSVLTATWSCQDPETNVSSIDIAFGLQPGRADAMSFTSLLVSQTSFIIGHKLQLGYRYFATVRCTNKVGLAALSFSDGLVYDNTPPSFVYLKDSDYQSSNRTLVITFKFVDAESGVTAYNAQVWGHSASSSLDSYGSFVLPGNVTRATLHLSKDLVSGATYYVNVTAVNGVDLKATEQSDGFIVDMTPPICSRVWDGKGDCQDEQEFATTSSQFAISWECYDNESSIARYRFAVKDVFTSKYLFPFHDLKTRVNSTGSAVITGGGRTTREVVGGQIYSSGIEIENSVGLKTVYWTNGVTLDSTSPLVYGVNLAFYPQNESLKADWSVSDIESGVKYLSWGLGTIPEENDIKNYTVISPIITNISVETFSFPQGITCFLNLFAINNVGLSSRSSSNAVIIDRSAPDPGVVAAYYAFPPNYDRYKNKAPNSSLTVSWTGFTDLESGIKMTSWAIGTHLLNLKRAESDLYTKVAPSESVGGIIIQNQTLWRNNTYFVCVRVTNGAGLYKTDCSTGMLIILGQLSAGVVSDGPVTSTDDTDFQLDDKAIWAHWDGFTDPVFGIVRYNWCIMDQSPSLSGSDICKWPFTEVSHLKTSASRFHNLTLSHGNKYFVTVKAENVRGDTITSSSDGVVIDRTPPIGKAIKISPSSGKDTLFITSPLAPKVTWSIDDPESGISHFTIGIGSLPFQDDLLSIQHVDRLSHSIDLNLANFTVYEGLSFFVTVSGVNMLGLETSLVSQQVVMDWTPPSVGSIVDGKRTDQLSQTYNHSDDQRKKATLFCDWSSFKDSESDVIEYRWCVGTSQGSCDVRSMVSADLSTYVEHKIIPQEDSQYFFTLEAINGAGLQRTTTSDGIIVDTSPPVIAGIYHGDEREEQNLNQTIFQNDGEQLSFYWDEPYDVESGISSVKWCAGTTNYLCDIVPLTLIEDPKVTFAKYFLSKSLTSGTVVFMTLTVTNGVGMKTEVSTSPLLIDNTPPTPGNVTVGNTDRTKYFNNGDVITAKWNGFVDSESHVNYFEWVICLASTTEKCISLFVKVGLRKTQEIDALGLTYGVSYVVIVRAFNKAGLFREASSNQFIVSGKEPSPGTVYDGTQRRKDIEFQSSTTQLSANWSPFIDINGNILDYKMCVGEKPGVCDVIDFVSVGINLKGIITGLSLNHKEKYFVTVQATSESGYITAATSNGVTVDSTPAIKGKVRDGTTLTDIDYQNDYVYIYCNWDNFRDEESDVTSYTWCAGTTKGSCDVVKETDVGDRTSVSQQILPPLPEGIEIFLTVSALNRAGMSSVSFSDGFQVDSTPPVFFKVEDLQLRLGHNDIDFLTAKESYCVKWDVADTESGIRKSEVSVCSKTNPEDCLLQGFDVGNQTSICVSDLEFEEGFKYVSKIRTENKAGLFKELFSDGFVVDTTPPFMSEIVYTHKSWTSLKGFQVFSHSQIAVQWDGFLDQESGIQRSYVCLGTTPGKCNIKNFTAMKNDTYCIFEDSLLVQGETYFISVKAENKAGLTSEVKTSNAIVVDKTGPFNEGVIRDGSIESHDIDAQQSRTLLAAHWYPFEDLESDVLAVTWCAGMSAGACDIVKETQMDPDSTSFFKVLTLPIMTGTKYYVTVTATNGAGATTSITSDGVIVDDTPPSAGIVIDGVDSDEDYLNGEGDITAHWFDFEDVESGIDSYEVALCNARNLSFCSQQFTGVGKATNVTFTGSNLQRGFQYRFIVTAVNRAGLKINAYSNGFTVDFTPPTTSKAWVGNETSNLLYHSDSSRMTVRWIPFIDPESGVEKYEVCLSSFLHNCSVTSFIDVGLNTSYIIDGLQLLNGKTYHAIVRGTNRIGMSSETTTDGVLIDLTPPTLKRKLQELSPVLFRCTEEHLMSSWNELEDLESGVVEYKWCVGTAKTSCDVVPLRSVGKETRSSAIVNRLLSGLKIFSNVYGVNGAKFKKQIISEPCTVITEAPNLVKVIETSRLETSNFSDIDWQDTVKNLSLSWNLAGKYLRKVSRLRIQVAVTTLSSNLSVPRVIETKSWNGELLKQPYMDVLPRHRNVTIQSILFQPWNRYRGIVKVWNEGGIYSEAASDGVKIEPNPPPVRRLKIRDKAAKVEHLRWWPNLRLSPLNQGATSPDITYISSPTDLDLIVSRGASKNTPNKTYYSFNHNKFSPTAEFKIVVKRASIGENNTNTTFHSKTIKVLPGFSNSEGPCCARRSVNAPTVLSDTHLKPALPTEDFGASIAILPNGKIAIGSKGKVVIQSLETKTASYSIPLESGSDPNARVQIASSGNRLIFLLNGKVQLYEHASGDSGFRKIIEIENCENITRPLCSENKTWTNAVGEAFAANKEVVAVTGTMPNSKNSVVAIFRANAGTWGFAQVLGKEMMDPHFGRSIALNERLVAITTGDGKNSCVAIYSITTLLLHQTICLASSLSHTGPLAVYLTKTNVLVVLSRSSRLLQVYQLNSSSATHQVVCEYRAWTYKEHLSGHLDVNAREEGFIVALGIQIEDGGEGVQLLGFQGIYSNDFHGNVPQECINLGTVLARESGLTVDGLKTRTTVAFERNTILFGLPNVLTWPNKNHGMSTGRVFIATYCPLRHFRSRVAGLHSLRPEACLPCKQGRKSFGGFSETCSECAKTTCPSSNDPYVLLTTGICDDESCVSPKNLSKATHGINFHLRNGSFFVPGPNNVYTVEFIETTRAIQSTRSLSESFLIDSTAPETGVVYDGLGSDQNVNCSENTTFGENSQCSTRHFQDTDINFTPNTREIHARWTDFLDNDSGIAEYFWCIGSQPMKDDIRVCESTGIRPNGSHYGLNLKHGDSYYVTVVACNGAHKCSAAHSDGVTIDITPPVMKYVRDGVMGPDMDYQVFLDIIFAYFLANDPDSGVTSYEVAWGTGPNLTDISDYEEIINTTVWRAKLKDAALEMGKRYYATVQATNGAGLLSERLSSDGVIVGKTEFTFENSSKGSFFFDTVNVNDNGKRNDGGVGQTYGTMTVPEGSVKEKVTLRCYRLDDETISKNETEGGPVVNPADTKPKQFLLGNYTFLIKALNPLDKKVEEGYKFAKPIKISMFYDVGNLVKANGKHVNNDLTKEDVDPVLYLWDPDNQTWFDAALTCPEPWSHVNRSIRQLEVNVCHLTQFAFFWSFAAQNGLILFDKKYLNKNIKVVLSQKVAKLEIPVRRSKGSLGNITVRWSLYHNDSIDITEIIWPSSGRLSMADGQWIGSLTLNVANNIKKLPQNVIWVKLLGTTGGALLSSENETATKIVLTSTLKEKPGKWFIYTFFLPVASVITIVIFYWRAYGR